MSELWDIYDKNRVKTGRTVERGKPMAQDEYRIIVHIWIRNSRGEWLISKRTPNKHYPNMWECTGGSAISGEASLPAAKREVKEELGVDLENINGQLFKSYIRLNEHSFVDVWLFECDCPIENIVLQEGETCDAMWATKDKIFDLIDNGEFIEREIYIDELFENYTVKAVPATESDIPGWLNLVEEVAPSFPGLDIVDYTVTLKKNISRKTALCVKHDGRIIGILLFSQGCLSCIAVHPSYRRRGVASTLVDKMLRLMPDDDITVTTFREGDESGSAPRKLYEKFG